MKTKITYLLFLIPLMTFAQGPFNFDTSTEGFTCNSSGGALGPHTVTQIGGDLKVGFVDLTDPSNPLSLSGNNPIIRKVDAGIDADTNINFIEIRLKNSSAISYLRLCPAFLGSNYGSIQISTGDLDYKTYTIDVTAWAGNPVGIDILCKKFTGSNAGGAYTPVAGESILIDYIKPLAFLTTPEVNVFNFDIAAQGFDKTSRATAVPATESGKGTLKINATTAAATNAKVALSSLVAHVEGANKYAHITLKNTSTTNTLFQLNGKVAGVGTAFNPIQTYTTADADYKTYDFDLSTWDNGYQFPELNFAVKDTWTATPTVYAPGDIVIVSNTYYKSLTGDNTAVDAAALKLDTTNWVIVNATGSVADATPATNGAIVGGALDISALTNSVYVDSIVFDNIAPVLGTANFGYANNTISLYPNPAQEVLNVSSANSITKIEVYDLLGKKVASNKNAKNVNVAALGKGVYIVKVAQENGSVVAKRFIKQ